MDMDIRFVTVPELIPIRSAVLRPGQAPERCRFKTDENEGTFHLGVFKGGTLACIASFHIAHTPVFPVSGLTYRLRGLGTLPECRRLGLARALVLRAEEVMLGRGAVGWWCHAREVAFDFYTSMGLVFHGDMFMEEDVGPHRLMLKRF